MAGDSSFVGSNKAREESRDVVMDTGTLLVEHLQGRNHFVQLPGNVGTFPGSQQGGVS